MTPQKITKDLKHLICAILLLFTLNISAQSHLQLEANFLVGFQSQKELNQRELTNSQHLGFLIGANWQIMLYKRIYIETGVYGKFVQGQSETELACFTSKLISAQLALLIGFKGTNKWQYSGGLIFENNRDFEDMNINQPFNLRYYASAKTCYQIKSKLGISLSANFNLAKIPKSYLIINPANYASLGVIYKLI